MTDPKEFCRTIGGEALCCSKPCQALGTGAPQVQVLDPSNPAGGGIQLHYQGVRAHEDDPHQCSYDPESGGSYARLLVLEIGCDPIVEGLDLLSVEGADPKSCRFVIKTRSKYGCGVKRAQS